MTKIVKGPGTIRWKAGQAVKAVAWHVAGAKEKKQRERDGQAQGRGPAGGSEHQRGDSGQA